MSEVQRGAPTEDGDYDLFLSNGNYVTVRRIDGKFHWHNGDAACCNDGSVLAHRKHEPIKVPELKEIPGDRGTDCVVRYDGLVRLATKYHRDCGYDIYDPCGSYPLHYAAQLVTELTREQCEAEGYAWPF
jgi:hypothetical protein